MPAFIVGVLCLLAGCRASRHVPEGEYLLDRVRIEIDDSTKKVKTEDLINYVRQQPNHKVLWGTKLQLGIYNMSGSDTTKWWNRWIRRIGQAPVVYDKRLQDQSVVQLEKAMINRGYMDAVVEADTIIHEKARKIDVEYKVTAGLPHVIKSVAYEFPNDTLRNLIMRDSAKFAVKPGRYLDRTLLDAERAMIAQRLRDRGYYSFAKEYITYSADTTAGSYDVDLTVIVNEPDVHGDINRATHLPAIIRSVVVVADYDPSTMTGLDSISSDNETEYKGIKIIYGKKRYLRPSVIYENCFLQQGRLYSTRDVDRTYESLMRLSILDFINIRFRPAGELDGKTLLDAYILLTPGKSQTISFELEGTNSEGDLGFAAALGYTHRNIGRGSETFSARFRGVYESLSGNLDGFIHNRFMEYSLESSLSYPKFMFPFVRESFKRKIKATTDFDLSLSYQERPEYTRIVAGVGWAYRWHERNNQNRHTFKMLDLNYVYLPESTNDFINQIAPDNPLLRYSYEDHFIMGMSYSFYRTNKRRETLWNAEPQRNIFTLRVSAETAGNLLFAINSAFTHRDNFREEPYEVFGIRYSQYAKAEIDFALLHTFDRRQSVAFHAGFGIGVPYGNSTILPFEKRFYGGGANGVRGWDVRTLGPGNYDGKNSVSNFINQCGDIRFILSGEYRAKLFWVVEMAAFVDIGNIWTIHNYANQPGGMFHFNSFYKELAGAYGLGIRLDFTYFLLRLDLGMKAHNPAKGQEPWPLFHPKWSRDSSWHFSIGYPF